MSQIQARRPPHWMRSYRPHMNDQPDVHDPRDVATVSFEVDAGDRPTSSLESRATRDSAEPLTESVAATAVPSPAVLREIGPGSVLRGRYLIEKAIGIGGTATVFSALDRHRSSARANGYGSEQGDKLHGFGRIALKVLRADAGTSDARVFRMEREFRQMQRLTHTGIVRVFDLDCEDNLWFITMQLLEGQPLHRHLRSGLTNPEALRILTQCAEALAYAHDQGIVHGDLKPSNVFVTQDGGVRLFDFGSAPDLAEAASESATVHRFAATPPYASPETLEGRGVDTRDEIFSLGCLAYELLSGGRHPFDRKSSADARQQGLQPRYADGIQPRQFAAIVRALSWERMERPASVREFLQGLLAPESSRETTMASSAPVERPTTSAATANPLPAPPTASEAVDAPPTVEVHAAASAATPTSPMGNPATDTVAPQSAAVPDALAYEEVNTQSMPPLVDEGRRTGEERAAQSAAAAAEQSSTAEPAPPVDLDDPSPKKFAGFVPPEMLARPKRTPGLAPAVDLHVSGLSQGSPWIKRTLAITLLALALLAGFFVLGRQLPEPAVSVAPPVVPDAKTSSSAVPEPESTPAIPVPQESAPVKAPAPPAIPAAPGEVSFESETVKVSASQSMAVVNVARLKSTRGAVPIKWSTVADTARPGVHYESVDSKMARFNDGQNVRSLFIHLKHDPAEASRPARSFIVKLEKAAGGPALGAITQARVIVEGIQ